jgi:hypothetical protein
MTHGLTYLKEEYEREKESVEKALSPNGSPGHFE